MDWVLLSFFLSLLSPSDISFLPFPQRRGPEIIPHFLKSLDDCSPLPIPAALPCQDPHLLYLDPRFSACVFSFHSAHQPSEEYSLNEKPSTSVPCLKLFSAPALSPVTRLLHPWHPRLAPAFHHLTTPTLLGPSALFSHLSKLTTRHPSSFRVPTECPTCSRC